MSIIVAVVATKGGACKTTTAVSLTVALEEGIVGPVRLLDTDPQGTAAKWLPWRSHSLRPTSADEVRRATAGEGVTIVDTQPAATDSAVAVMEAADLLVAPTRLGVGDLDAFNQLCRMVTPDLIVPCAFKARTTSHAQALDLLRERFGDRITAPVPDSIIVDTAQNNQDGISTRHPVARAYAAAAARHMIAAEGLTTVGQMIVRHRGGGRFTTDDEIARITVALRDLRVRDDAWARMDPSHTDAHLRLWTDVTRRAQPGYLAAPAALLALARCC